MGLLKLAFDRQNKSLVSFNGSVTTLPPVYQGNVQDIRIQIVDSAGSPFRPAITAVDCAAFELRAVIATAVTGETDSVLAATYAAGWSWDAGDQCFTGQIDLNTEEVNSFIGPASFKAAILEVSLVNGSERETVFSATRGATNIVINATADDDESAAPSILSTPPTIARVTLEASATVTFTDNVVAISGLGLGFTPSYFLLFMEAPADYGPITANFIVGSGSSDGFSAVLSAVPEVATYKLVYIPVE